MPTRRHVIFGIVAAPVMPRFGYATGVPQQLSLTPACGDLDDLTPPQTEGPYFTPNSPEKRDFTSDAPDGEKIMIARYLLTKSCHPVAKALVELWHADESGSTNLPMPMAWGFPATPRIFCQGFRSTETWTLEPRGGSSPG